MNVVKSAAGNALLAAVERKYARVPKKNTRVFLKKRATNSGHKQTRKEKVYELEEVFGGVVWVLGCASGCACRGWMLADGQ